MIKLSQAQIQEIKRAISGREAKKAELLNLRKQREQELREAMARNEKIIERNRLRFNKTLGGQFPELHKLSIRLEKSENK